MDFRQIRYFIAVAEELSFTRAAKRCGISQPPLSRSIAVLEEQIGARLFERNKSRVTLTPAGAELLEDAKRVLELISGSFQRVRQIDQGEAGCLTVGLGGATVYTLIPRLVRQFKEAYPNVQFIYRAVPIPEQLAALNDGEIDIGVVRLPVSGETIETLSVHVEKSVLALPSTHPTCSKPGPVKLSELKDESFISYPSIKGFGYLSDFFNMCRHVGFVPRITHDVSSTEAIVSVVSCGEGIALIPETAAGLPVEGVEFRNLDTRELPISFVQANIGLAWHTTHASQVVRTFVAHTERCMRSRPTC